MAFRRALLIAAVALLGARAASATPSPAPSGCSSCHAGRHYADFGTCTDCHRGDARSRRAGVAHDRMWTGAAAAWRMPHAPALAEGRRLRDQLGCRRCHVTGGAGNTLAISLDAIAWRRDQAELRLAILHPATFMPDFGLSRDQADRVIAAVLHDADPAGREGRYLVRFRDGTAPPSAFATRCGPCHRALTPRGPLGVGSAGPNLSGLLTPFYPRRDGRAWDRERLERWVRNPRAENAVATMAPVPLRAGELDEIARALETAPAGAAPARATRPR